MDLVALLAHGQPQTVARLELGDVELVRGREDRHELHGTHAERTDRLVANEDEVGGGPFDQLTSYLVGGRAKDRSPQADGEGNE
jgi:hypothetical protein